MFDYADGRSYFTTRDEPVEWFRLGLLLIVPILAVCLGALCTRRSRPKKSSRPESTLSGTSPTDKTTKQPKEKAAAGATEGKPKDTQVASTPDLPEDDIFQSECILLPGYQDHYISKAWSNMKNDAVERTPNDPKQQEQKHDKNKSKRALK